MRTPPRALGAVVATVLVFTGTACLGGDRQPVDLQDEAPAGEPGQEPGADPGQLDRDQLGHPTPPAEDPIDETGREPRD